MAVKTVTRHAEQARHIATGARFLAAHAAERFEATLAGSGVPLAGLPDMVHIQKVGAEWLLRVTEELEAADRAYERQRDVTRVMRKARDERTAHLYPHLVRLRKALVAAYGPAYGVLLSGLEGKTPREPAPLARAARRLIGRLRDATIEPPAPRVPGWSLDREATAAALETDTAALEEALSAVSRSRARETPLLAEREQALARFRDVKTGVSEMLEGIYRTAELDHLVPGLRKPGAAAAAAVPHRVEPRAEGRTAAPHPVERRPEGETTAPHPVEPRSEGETTPPHPVEGRSKGETTPPHRVEERSEGETTPPPRVEGRSVEGAAPLHRVVRRWKRRLTLPHGSAGSSQLLGSASRPSGGRWETLRRAPDRSWRRWGQEAPPDGW